MSQRKKHIKGIIIVMIFVTLIFVSSLPTSDNFSLLPEKEENFTQLTREKERFPLNSALNLTDYITGDGVNQTIRVYMDNKSTIDNKEGNFEIKAPADNMNLSKGEFDFNFNNNFTTDYVIEEDDALDPNGNNYFEEYRFNDAFSNLTFNEGSGDQSGGFFKIVDGDDNSTFWNLTSSINGVLNFTIMANFSDVSGAIQTVYPIDFNRSNIVGFILNFTYKLSRDANVTVNMKDFFDTGKFRNKTTTTEINHTKEEFHSIDKLIINENLNYINKSDCSLVQFIFNRTDSNQFNLSLYEFDIVAILALELPITNDSYVALEFDLRGAKSNVNGFYAWIRTLNATKVQLNNIKLNISLYYATGTVDRTDLTANDNINPNLTTGLIDSKLFDYTGDGLSYFNFNISNTNNLTRFNYFIVIRSTHQDVGIYSLVTIPRGTFGDSDLKDHLLKSTNDNGNTWNNAISNINIDATNLELDATQFKLNITRGYIPSDFNGSLNIQGIDIDYLSDAELFTIYSGEPILKWGLGRWHHNFTNPIGSDLFNNFQINLNWDTNIINGFEFNVTYTVEAFRTENATSTYFASYDQQPQWIFNYTLNLDLFNIYKWNFTEFWYIYQEYFQAQNLTTPDGTQIPNIPNRQSDFNENHKKLIISTSVINVSDKLKYNGTYSLNLTSPNAILESNMHSYINYKNTLWETQGFMYGDNISVLLDIQDHNDLAPPSANGFANISLFYPDGTLLSYISSSSGTPSIDGTKLTYDFDNNTILDLTKIIPLASNSTANHYSKGDHYSLGYFWTNGSEIGCNRIPIYIDAYDINFKNITFIRDKGVNLLSGDVDNHVILPYTLLAASINETSAINNPNFYSVSNLDVNQMFTYEQWGSGIPVTILMKSFQQNETVLNPEEDISFKVSIQNRFFASLNIKFSVKLVSLANEEWIIDEDESDTKNLELFGAQGDTKDFNVTLSIPEYNTDLTWEGQNAPIRQGGVKTIISLYIEDNFVGTFESNDYSLIVNSTEDLFEGEIIALKQLPFSDTFTGRYFERDECLYLPNQSTFIYNVFDENYVSIYTQAIKKFDLNLDSNFTNILFPSEIRQGEVFNITSNLVTELGEILPNKLVYLQYERNGIWINTSTPQNTSANGETNFEVNTLNINILGTTPFKLSWAGDVDYLNKSNIFQVPIEVALNKLSLSSKDDESFLYNNRKSTIEFTIKNSGNSTLRIDIDDIDVDIDHGFDYDIIGKDEIILKPGDSETIQIEIEVGNIGFEEEVEVHVEIKAVNILTNKIILVSETIDLDIIDTPLIDYIIEYFLFIIIAILGLMLFIAYYYSRHIKKKIELSAKEVSEKRPRRGKYVKVSELKVARAEKLEETTEEIEEIKPKKEIIEEEVLEKEKKTIDLDTLLEKEELKKKEVSKKIPKHPEKKEKRPKEKEKAKKIKEKPAKTKKVKEKKKKMQKAKKKLEAKKIETEKPLEVEPKKVESKKTTDLDTLLEEKGLKDDKEPKKVPKKVSEPAKRIKKSSPKPLSTRKMVEKRRGKKKSRKKKRY